MLHQLIAREQVIFSQVLHIHYIPKYINLSTPSDCLTDIALFGNLWCHVASFYYLDSPLSVLGRRLLPPALLLSQRLLWNARTIEKSLHTQIRKTKGNILMLSVTLLAFPCCCFCLVKADQLYMSPHLQYYITVIIQWCCKQELTEYFV